MQRGMSVRELAQISQVSKTQINMIEAERTEANPTLLTICKLAESLGIKPEDIYCYKVENLPL